MLNILIFPWFQQVCQAFKANQSNGYNWVIMSIYTARKKPVVYES